MVSNGNGCSPSEGNIITSPFGSGRYPLREMFHQIERYKDCSGSSLATLDLNGGEAYSSSIWRI
jgi:hypothetical protein